MLVLALQLPVTEDDVCPFVDVGISGPETLYPDNYIAVAAARVAQARAEDTFDAAHRVVEARRQARRRGRAHVRLAAQLEFELPALRRIFRGQAVHFQRADLGQRGRQLHRPLAPAFAARSPWLAVKMSVQFVLIPSALKRLMASSPFSLIATLT